VTKVFDATTNAIMALAGELAAQHVDWVVVESTSGSWRPFGCLLGDLLEARSQQVTERVGES
jgi:2-polyprenyl-6-methoxyphenol hydroxylase-like FAD-dependent oxidoreductase